MTERVGSRWVPAVALGSLGLGFALIVVNYVGVLLPGSPSNWWLMGGLGFVLVGIIAATGWR